ncbi:rhomboid family intramembrane serine protease [Candidatus Micrarchaeota archaeon]|nr:rhomboid family intramembrane serine protease [Candidatus Micrarchaeota archaeon]
MVKVTHVLLLIIGLVFIAQMLVPGLESAFVFDPLKAFSEPWRFVTSIFLHGGLSHIFFNCWSLLLFGTLLESRLTKQQYLMLFLLGGISGGITYYLSTLFLVPPIPALGASGAIYAILGALAIILPELTIYFFFIPMNIRVAAMVWFVLEFLGSFDSSSGIASAGHLGGLLFGLLYGYFIMALKNPVRSVTSNSANFVYNSSAPDRWEFENQLPPR